MPAREQGYICLRLLQGDKSISPKESIANIFLNIYCSNIFYYI